ncbi:MAG: hypothetical protein FJZ92_12025 [Chloroflexi bacterium]|nr:hypothetical protein [Chloroflexota bacterium]
MTREGDALALRLFESMGTTLRETLDGLGEHDLDRPCSHGCAMGGGVRRLLVHNAEHDRQHAAAISNARIAARAMQESQRAMLLRDWLRERVELIGQLLGAGADVLDLTAPGDEWSVREHVEHVLHWERDSMDVALAEVREAAAR